MISRPWSWQRATEAGREPFISGRTDPWHESTRHESQVRSHKPGEVETFRTVKQEAQA